MSHSVPLVVPPLDLTGLTLSTWLVKRGALVAEGDRLVELLADGVTVDLSAPTSGRVVEFLVAEEEPVDAGQILGRIEAIPDVD